MSCPNDTGCMPPMCSSCGGCAMHCRCDLAGPTSLQGEPCTRHGAGNVARAGAPVRAPHRGVAGLPFFWFGPPNGGPVLRVFPSFLHFWAAYTFGCATAPPPPPYVCTEPRVVEGRRQVPAMLCRPVTPETYEIVEP